MQEKVSFREEGVVKKVSNHRYIRPLIKIQGAPFEKTRKTRKYIRIYVTLAINFYIFSKRHKMK